jgi:hypothetical protein
VVPGLKKVDDLCGCRTLVSFLREEHQLIMSKQSAERIFGPKRVSKVKGKRCPVTRHEGERERMTSALDGGEWSASRPGRALPPGKDPRYPLYRCTGGWVGPRVGLDAEAGGKILCLCRGLNPGRPVRIQTLY